MKTQNKIKKAFDYKNTKYLFYDLYEYILLNIDEKELAIQDKKMYVFENYFTPQTTGTEYQKQTYKKVYIENMISKIIKYIGNDKI